MPTPTTAPDPEPYLDACKASLIAGMPSRVSAINGEHSDFEIAAPDDDNYVIGGYTITDYPTVEIAAPDVTLTGLSLGQAGADFDFRAIVRVLDHDATQAAEQLYRRMMRLARAVVEVMFVPNAFGQGTVIDKERGAAMSFRFNPEVEERQEIVAFVVITFWVNATVGLN